MLPVFDIDTTGVVNRIDAVDALQKGEVLSRENLRVIGINAEKRNKKFPGSDRYNSTEVSGGIFLSGYRYYNVNFAVTFLYWWNKGSEGRLYHIDNLGNLTLKETLPVTGYPQPCWAQIKVSGNNLLLFSDGFNDIWSYDGNLDYAWINRDSGVSPVWMEIHLDRVFAFEENSDVLLFAINSTGGGNPTDFDNSTDAGEITVEPSRGSRLQWGILDNETLYLWKNDKICVLEGRTPSEFSIRVPHPDKGTPARHSVIKGESTTFFLADDIEFYSFGGSKGSTQLISYKMAVGGDLSKDLVPIINENRMDEIVACYHDHLYRCSFVESGEVINKLEYFFDTTNKTDGLTRGNNVSCYLIYDKVPPNNKQLLTGRTDAGYMMYQHRGLNWDNNASSPTMSVKIQSAFVKLDQTIMTRVVRVFGNFQVLGAEDLRIRHFIDARNATSDSVEIPIPIQGETKNITNFIRVNAQASVTTRQVMPWARAKALSHSLKIDMDRNNIDLSFSKFQMEIVKKNRKMRKAVGI